MTDEAVASTEVELLTDGDTVQFTASGETYTGTVYEVDVGGAPAHGTQTDVFLQGDAETRYCLIVRGDGSVRADIGLLDDGDYYWEGLGPVSSLETSVGVFVYYETIDGDAGLAELTETGLQEVSGGEYGTNYELDWDSFEAFVRGAYDEIDDYDDIETDADGFHYPDGYIRFRVLAGRELGPDEWADL